MKVKKPKLQGLIILGATAGLLSLFSIAQLLGSTRPTTDSSKSFMRNEFLSKLSKADGAQLFLGKKWFDSFASRELVDPKNFLPDGNRLKTYARWLLSVEKCDNQIVSLTSKDLELNQSWKLHSFYNVKCLKGELDPALWKKPPFIHPKGGSWAAFIWKSQKLSDSWAQKNRRYFHVSEWKLMKEKYFSETELIIRGLDVSSMQAVVSGEELFLAGEQLFVLTGKGFEHATYKIVTSDGLDKIMQGSGLDISIRYEGDCLFEKQGLCLKVAKAWIIKRYFWLGLFSICICVLFSTPLILAKANLKQRKLLNQQRDITFQTLAHELRHPATSINLSLEFLRDRFEKLDEDLQIEVLRMVDEVNRLKRLVKASEQYLVSTKEGQFLSKPTRILSVNSFLGRISRQYGVDFEPLTDDLSFVCDAYWLGVCTENLIKNALKHGAKPVIVKTDSTSTEKSLIIHVTDRGNGLQKDLSESLSAFVKGENSQGLGLGLTITSNVASLIHADLTYSSAPTTFTLTIQSDKEPHDEQNLAS